MKVSRILELMPDTGHHYYFFPLGIRQDYSGRESIRKEYEIPVKPDLTNKLVEFEKTPQWVAAAGAPWMRLKVGVGDLYRLDASGIAASYDVLAEAIGVWLVVETNTGDEGRGYPFPSENMPGVPDWLTKDPPTPPRPPYVKKDAQLLDGQIEYDLLKLYPALAVHLKGMIDAFPFTIKWLEEKGKPFPVDLIVDFGNSRTLALLLESAQKAEGAKPRDLSQICRPLVFSEQRQDHERGMHRSPLSSHCVVDSWFILRKPEFAIAKGSQDNIEFSPENFYTDDYDISIKTTGFLRRQKVATIEKATRRIPHMFTEISPAAIGPGSYAYFAKLRGAAVRCSLSSPKRYAWDKSPVGDFGDVYWHMMTSPRSSEPVLLSGEIMAFMPFNEEERFYSDSVIEQSPHLLMEKSPVERPNEPLRNGLPRYSKSDGLIWTALAIIEQAHRSINCQATRVRGALTRRFLKDIVVTFPSGWTQEEIDSYYRAWQYARNIFFWSRYGKSRDGDGLEELQPSIRMHIDEAVASQLPVIYSEIRHLGDLGLWLELFGRERGGQQSCRVMSMDIGGGTLDTAVVEYSRPGGHTKSLTPRILFTDSSTRAGDKLVKTIIDEVLIPHLLAKHPAVLQARIRDVLTRSGDFAAVNKRVALVKLVFIPIVQHWLSGLSGDVTKQKALTPAECGVNSETLLEFNQSVLEGLGGADVFNFQDPMDIEYKKLNDVVAAWISQIAEAHARYLAAFQCDLVVVTGKPSEIKTIRGILEMELPIEPYRVIFARGYYAGNWLPLGGSGPDAKRIQDAKFVTATGAALAQAFDRELLSDFSLTKIERGSRPLPNWWYHLNDSGAVQGPPLLPPEIETAEVDVSPNMTIGRVRFPGSEPERVYIFRSKTRGRYSQLKAKVKRLLTDADGKTTLLTERLELISVSGEDENGERIDPSQSLDEFELCLNTLGGNYWLDQPEFDLVPGT
jgi:hypothetical protein